MLAKLSEIPVDCGMKYLPVLCFFLLHPISEAASLIATSPNATNMSSVNLTAEGTSNWAIWNSRTNPDTTPAPDFFMAGETTGSISEISRTSGSGVRGTDSLTSYPTGVFTWTNSNDNTVPDQISGMFTTTDQTTIGVQFSITDLPALSGGLVYQINVYGSAFRGRAEVTASVSSLTAVVDGITKAEAKAVEQYQFFYNPDSAIDVLTLRSLLEVDNGSNAHALLYGVSIAVVPEPSSLLLSAFGLLSILGLRRR